MTTPFYVDDHVTLYAGDSLTLLRAGAMLGYEFELGYEPTRLVPDCSVDAVVTDPPYGIGFMGHEWDQPGQYGSLSAGHGGSNISYNGAPHPAMEAGRYDLSRPANVLFGEWCEAWARECLRVLKPGGHIIAFGGARTWHRLACAIEDAGFELRDSIAWLFASGFPKSLDVGKAIDRASGAVREPGDFARDRTAHLRNGRYASGPAGFSTERGTALAAAAGPPVTDDARSWDGWGTALKPAFEPMVLGRKPFRGTVAGNVLAHGTGGLHVDACRTAMSDADAAAINAKHAGMDPDDYQRPSDVSLNLSVNPMPLKQAQAHDLGRWPMNVVIDAATAQQLGDQARYFPTFQFQAKAPASERPTLPDGTAHPTVKPLDLMRWCVRLVTPPGGTVLDPFFGSGTTGEACVIEGFQCLAFERHQPYLRLAADGRLGRAIQRDIFGGVA